MSKYTFFIIAFIISMLFGAFPASAQTVSVTLNGSGSFDNDGFIVKYEWFENEVLIGTGVRPTVNLTYGVHNITIVVTDDDGDMDSDVVVITVNQPPNQPPVADAGPDQMAQITTGGSTMVTMNGSLSYDPDGSWGPEALLYSWTRKRKIVGIGERPMFPLGQGRHTIQLTVMDMQGAEDSDSMIVTVAKKSR